VRNWVIKISVNSSRLLYNSNSNSNRTGVLRPEFWECTVRHFTFLKGVHAKISLRFTTKRSKNGKEIQFFFVYLIYGQVQCNLSSHVKFVASANGVKMKHICIQWVSSVFVPHCRQDYRCYSSVSKLQGNKIHSSVGKKSFSWLCEKYEAAIFNFWYFWNGLIRKYSVLCLLHFILICGSKFFLATLKTLLWSITVCHIC